MTWVFGSLAVFFFLVAALSIVLHPFEVELYRWERKNAGAPEVATLQWTFTSLHVVVASLLIATPIAVVVLALETAS